MSRGSWVTVIGALIMRELQTRYGKGNIGFLWVFAEPLIFTVVVLIFCNIVKGNETHGTVPLLEFLLTGYPGFTMWRHCVTRSFSAISANGGLLYHRQIRVIDIVLARSFLEVAGTTISFIVVGIALLTLGLVSVPHDFGLILYGWLSLAYLGVSMSLIFAGASELSDALEKIMQSMIYVMYPASGVFYMVEWIPSEFQDLVLLIPTLHGFEAIRDGYFGEAIKTHYDPYYLFATSTVFLLIGIWMTQVARNRMHIE